MTYSDNPPPVPPQPPAGGSSILIWIVVGMAGLFVLALLATGFFWFALSRGRRVSLPTVTKTFSSTEAIQGRNPTFASMVGWRLKLQRDTPVLVDERNKPVVNISADDLDAALEAKGAKYLTMPRDSEMVVLFETKRDDVSWYHVEVFPAGAGTISFKGWTNEAEIQGARQIGAASSPAPASTTP